MPRFFLELSYKGTAYSGFQTQQNAITIQSEVEKAINTFFRNPPSPLSGEGQRVRLTGSSRTDTGVHALQNFFHFDAEGIEINSKQLYHLNSILSPDIVLKNFYKVDENAHCRFDAVARKYQYFIYQTKNPFLADRAWYYPYALDMDALNEAATVIQSYTDFTSFAKRNAQVKTFNCSITEATWSNNNECLIFSVKANRFLRGMVKGLVGTMLKIGRGQLTIKELNEIIEAKDCTKADFTTPAHGLFLVNVQYPYLLQPISS